MAAEYTHDGKNVRAKFDAININLDAAHIEFVIRKVDKGTSENMSESRIYVSGDAYNDLLTRIGPTIKNEAWTTTSNHYKAELVGAEPDADLSAVTLVVS